MKDGNGAQPRKLTFSSKNQKNYAMLKGKTILNRGDTLGKTKKKRITVKEFQ